MVADIIGLGIQGVGSILGGMANKKAMKDARDKITRKKLNSQAWYDRRYNEDSTQRADAQRMIQRTEDAIKNRNRSASGTKAVIGGTDESVASTQAENSQALADAASSIAASGQAAKDAVEAQYMGTQQAIADQESQMDVAKAQNIAGAIKGVSGTASSIASAFGGDSILDKDKELQKHRP